MADYQNLNADAIYAAMVWLRNYAESSEGRAEYNALLEEKAKRVSFFREVLSGAPVVVHLRPVFEMTDALKEEIYPDEPDSVEFGIELARTLIWGPPGFASTLLDQKDPQDDQMTVAVSRFIADRAN